MNDQINTLEEKGGGPVYVRRYAHFAVILSIFPNKRSSVSSGGKGMKKRETPVISSATAGFPSRMSNCSGAA
jgi:hypothetical protein